MTWIQTFTGKKMFLWDPRLEDIVIEDIAQALSNLCRFTGHCNTFSSVAQHSVHVSEIAAKELMPDPQGLDMPRIGLMYDAAEAYLGDLSTPLKNMLSGFRRIEKGMEQAVSHRFGVPFPRPQEIKTIDTALLLAEAGHLLGEPPDKWDAAGTIKPYPIEIYPWSPEKAKCEFLKRFDVLFGTTQDTRDFSFPPIIPIDGELEEGDDEGEELEE